ncbi:MAG TPA: MFS transporter [Janthinobacterium sp.]|nr:MFS transporter [Janthinobacterium sp.]
MTPPNISITLAEAPSVPGRAGWGLAVICIGMFMLTVDGAALNLALPAIRRELQGSQTQLEWVVTAYTIPLAGLLLSTGALGDMWGARRLFIVSLLGFALTSLLCALSASLPQLIAARALQGVAAAGLLPMLLSLLAKAYRDKSARARAVNTLAVVGGIAMVVGPFGGGLLTEFVGWRAIFLINIPLGVGAALAAPWCIRETTRRAAPLDIPGGLAGIFALTALTGGLIEGVAVGWRQPLVLVLLAAGGAGIAAFLLIERHLRQPMLPLAVFRNRAFSAATAGGFAFQFGCYGMQFMLALFVQAQWALSPLRAGVMLLPFAVAVIATSMFLNPVLLPRGPRWMLRLGGAIAAAGALIAATVSTPDTWPLLLAGTALVGVGAGIFSSALNVVAVSSIAPEYAGLASGIYHSARQVGMAAGIAVLGGLVGGGAALAGVRTGLLMAAACFAAIVVLAQRHID